MRVKEQYQGIIRDIMKERNIKPLHSSPTYVVGTNTRFAEAVQHTDRYVGKGHDDQPGNSPHYRYNRYEAILRCLPIFEKRIVHVDIGCGAGLFSWALLDWATKNGVGRDRVEQYGYDHSSSMLKLAAMIRDELTQSIEDYPDAHDYYDIDPLLEQLSDDRRKDMDYIITFGHVLVQAQSRSAIASFTRIIGHVVGLMGPQSKCALVAVDAVRQPILFANGWKSLLHSLERESTRHQLHHDGDNAKYALLYSTG